MSNETHSYKTFEDLCYLAAKLKSKNPVKNRIIDFDRALFLHFTITYIYIYLCVKKLSTFSRTFIRNRLASGLLDSVVN